MPLTTSTQNTTDTLIGKFNTAIDAFQTTYCQANGKYWQGIKTPSTPPEDGSTSKVEKDLKPTDVAEDWNSTSLISETSLPFSITVDVAERLGKHGYKTTYVIKKGDEEYRKVEGKGILKTETQDWFSIPADYGLT